MSARLVRFATHGSAVWLLCALGATAGATAQERTAILQGTITAADTETPVAGVNILLDGHVIAVTDGRGAFRVTRIVPGWHLLLVRSVGFAPAETHVEFVGGKIYDLTLALDPRAVELPPVTVQGLRLPSVRLQEIHERMATGAGEFITHDELEAWGVAEISMALARSPRVRLNFISPGECLEGAQNTGDAAMSRSLSRATPSRAARTPTPISTVPCQYLQARSTAQVMMGRGMQRCVPFVYLDGVRWELYGDQIDDITEPQDVELIEIYDEYEVPGEFAQGDLDCGVIAIWTRMLG